MITLEPTTYELLQKLDQLTGLSPSSTINRLLGAHMHELWEYRDWLAKQPVGSSKRALGANLLISYGPDDLMQGIRKIDPKHRFES